MSLLTLLNSGANAPTWAWRASDLSLAPYIGSGTPTVTRAGNTATRINSSGLIETVNANLARYDYSLAGVLQGLLVEPAATNIALRNNDLTNAVWVKGATVSVAKDQTGPDGVANSASRITFGAVAGTNTVLQTVVLASSSRKQSTYIKRLVGSSTVEMTTNGGTNWDAVTLTTAWTRVDIPARTVTNPSFGFRGAGNGDQIVVGYIQNETDILTSPTTEVAGTAVTRAADAISLATSSISGFNASALTMYGQARAQAGTNAADQYLFQIDDGTLNERHVIYRPATAIFGAASVDGGSVVVNVTGGTWTGGALAKLAYGVEANNAALYADGAQVGSTDTSVTMPTVTTVRLGDVAGSGASFSGHLVELRLYAQRLANATLQTLTQ